MRGAGQVRSIADFRARPPVPCPVPQSTLRDRRMGHGAGKRAAPSGLRKRQRAPRTPRAAPALALWRDCEAPAALDSLPRCASSLLASGCHRRRIDRHVPGRNRHPRQAGHGRRRPVGACVAPAPHQRRPGAAAGLGTNCGRQGIHVVGSAGPARRCKRFQSAPAPSRTVASTACPLRDGLGRQASRRSREQRRHLGPDRIDRAIGRQAGVRPHDPAHAQLRRQ